MLSLRVCCKMYLPFGLPLLECFKRNIYIFSDSQAAIKALDNSEIYPKLVRDCHQSPMVVVEHNNVQLLSVPGHKEWMLRDCWPVGKKRACCTHLQDLNLPEVSLKELQGRSSGTGCAGSTKNTGSFFQDRGMQRTFFLSSLLKGQLSSWTQHIKSKKSDRPVNRTLSLKGPPLQTGYNWQPYSWEVPERHTQPHASPVNVTAGNISQKREVMMRSLTSMLKIWQPHWQGFTSQQMNNIL
jgi:hypothetical protein